MRSPILVPLLALVLWSFVMWAWLYATRIPALIKLKIAYDPFLPNSEFIRRLPAEVLLLGTVVLTVIDNNNFRRAQAELDSLAQIESSDGSFLGKCRTAVALIRGPQAVRV